MSNKKNVYEMISEFQQHARKDKESYFNQDCPKRKTTRKGRYMVSFMEMRKIRGKCTSKVGLPECNHGRDKIQAN